MEKSRFFSPFSALPLVWKRVITLGLMYAGQGLPAGLAFNAYATILRERGVSLHTIGWSGLTFLPWALKFLWAGLTDNAGKRYGYGALILQTQILAILSCLVLAFFPPEQSFVFSLAGIILLNTVFATQDILTNAAAVSHLQGRNAGLANGIQVVAFLLGMLAGGGGSLLVYARIGWAGTLCAMAAALFLLCLILLPLRKYVEPDTSRITRPSRLKDFFHQKGFGWALASSLTFKFAGAALLALLQPFLIDQHVSVETIGTLQISNLLCGALGGAVLGTLAVKKSGSSKAVTLLAIPSALLLGAVWVLQITHTLSAPTLYLALGTESFFDGAFYVALWSLLMNWSSAERPGLDYSFLQCGESVANVFAASAIMPLASSAGYSQAFLVVWLCGLVLLAPLLLAARRLSPLCCDSTSTAQPLPIIL
ncbi:MFS transporter [Acetobacter malorum]|uniref:MFS transporter n=1 Tax=Acetobacter malorum TaxID=178901 RepID=UPI00248E6928|nr:MFS transporter [Acetobacter malorum]